jgi:hypothetical protein
MIIDERLYLEHFGVKGMRWGVRNKRPSGSSSPKSGEPDAAKAERRKEQAKKIAVGLGAAGIGVATAAMLVRHNKNKKMAEVETLHKNVLQAKRLFDAKKGLQIDALNREFNAGKITSSQGWRISDLLERDAMTKAQKSARGGPRLPTQPASPQRSAAVSRLIGDINGMYKLANEDLRRGYEANQTPLHLREYLKGM